MSKMQIAVQYIETMQAGCDATQMNQYLRGENPVLRAELDS